MYVCMYVCVLRAICYIKLVVKVCSKPSIVSSATRDSYRTLAKRLLYLYCKSSMATIYHNYS